MCLRASGHCSLRSVIAATFRNLVPKLKHSCSLCTSCCVTFPPGYLCICKQSIKAEVLSKSYAVWALFCSWKDYFCLNVSRFSSSVKLLYSETKFYSYNQILSTSRWRKQSLYRKRVILVQTLPLLEGCCGKQCGLRQGASLPQRLISIRYQFWRGDLDNAGSMRDFSKLGGTGMGTV